MASKSTSHSSGSKQVLLDGEITPTVIEGANMVDSDNEQKESTQQSMKMCRYEFKQLLVQIGSFDYVS